ncbi:hypothetical protein ABW21_db0202988 [Orbilia brochopaga]|nr:hypothetical protein ABW21_db0202988 [Drechslerella brochopaga]
MDVPVLPEQLPPQVFTTGAQLLDLTDKKLVIVLRDGRKLIGTLRSYDQYANLVLQDTVERLYSQDLYADVPRGCYIVRGENVLLLGEIDLDKEDDLPLKQATVDEIYDAQRLESANKKQKEKKKARKLHGLGFEAENELVLSPPSARTPPYLEAWRRVTRRYDSRGENTQTMNRVWAALAAFQPPEDRSLAARIEAMRILMADPDDGSEEGEEGVVLGPGMLGGEEEAPGPPLTSHWLSSSLLETLLTAVEQDDEADSEEEESGEGVHNDGHDEEGEPREATHENEEDEEDELVGGIKLISLEDNDRESDWESVSDDEEVLGEEQDELYEANKKSEGEDGDGAQEEGHKTEPEQPEGHGEQEEGGGGVKLTWFEI